MQERKFRQSNRNHKKKRNGNSMTEKGHTRS